MNQSTLNTHHKVAVLLPCYDEEDAIGSVVTSFKQHLPYADVYVYDNASADNTAKVAAEAGAIVRFEPLRGKGNVVRSMFRDVDADYYIMADGDGTYDASQAAELLNLCVKENLDMLVGLRKSVKNQKTYRSGHIFGNWLLNKIVQLFFAKRLKDILSGYRIFPRRFVKSFPILSDGFEIEIEMSVYALSLNMRIAEYETDYFSRTGNSKSKLNSYRDGSKILLFIIRLFKDYRPLILFSSLAFFFFSISTIFFLPIWLDFLEMGVVDRIPTLSFCIAGFIISVISMFSGFILDSVSRNNLRAKQIAFLQASN